MASKCSLGYYRIMKKKAELKGFFSPDIDDLKNFQPLKDDCFGFLLQTLVGPKGEEGEESFDIEIFTPKWLLSRYKKNEILFLRHSIIVFEYNYEKLMERITSSIERCSGETWDEVAEEVGRIGHWEFEDYQEEI